eukprot:TRINITY_DN5475_c0_g1_i2.p1 TRINITY_DN5475_c0_g1~~TRINITY_DN5475_c0_g1_i2.p1  ORF type:complete len:304 (+),score=83.37 TRINITY_DN5475_c0_g1_i2:1650-2561(+)
MDNVSDDKIENAVEVVEYLLKERLCNPIASNRKGKNALLTAAKRAFKPVRELDETEDDESSSQYSDSSSAYSESKSEHNATQSKFEAQTKQKIKLREEKRKKDARKHLNAQKAQRQFNTFFQLMLEQVHPFAQLRYDSGLREPLLSKLYEVSPKAAGLLLDRFQPDFDYNETTDKIEVKYDYALDDEHFMESNEAKDSVLSLLEEQKVDILRHEAIRALMEVVWHLRIRKRVIFEMILWVALLVSSCLLINLGVEPRTKLVWKVITVVLCAIVFLSAALVLLVEFAHLANQGIRYFKDPWNTP